ncbi:MAG TPA: CcmD family protein [Polyangiaceae bacterium]
MKVDSYARSFEGTLEMAFASGRAQAPPAPPADPAQRGTEFRAVEGGAETMSGGTLLVEAYAALWLILLGLLFVSWRRQSRIDARVAELERTMSRGGSK